MTAGGSGVLRIYDRLNQQSAIRFLDYVLEKLPFRVEVIQTDNGAEFQTQFHYHVLDRGIGPRLHQAGHAEAERQGRALPPDREEEFYRMLEGVVIDDTELFNDRLQEWEDSTTSTVLMGGLAGQTPYERLWQKTRSPARTGTVSCTPPRPPRCAGALSALRW